MNIAIKKGVAEKIFLQTKGTFKLATEVKAPVKKATPTAEKADVKKTTKKPAAKKIATKKVIIFLFYNRLPRQLLHLPKLRLLLKRPMLK